MSALDNAYPPVISAVLWHLAPSPSIPFSYPISAIFCSSRLLLSSLPTPVISENYKYNVIANGKPSPTTISAIIWYLTAAHGNSSDPPISISGAYI